MKNMLEEIYRGSYERTFVRSPEYEKAVQEMDKVWSAAEQTIDKETLEALWDTTAAISIYESYSDFRHGFRLGAALMLEVFAAPD